MKHRTFAVCSASVLGMIIMLGAAVAGMNPNGSFGLPDVDTSLTAGDNSFYSSVGTAVSGKLGSVMCVACHTRNPGARTAYRVAKGNYNYMGSHFVTRNFADTAKGGGYLDGTAPKNVRRTTDVYIADNAGQQNAGSMTVANNWYGAPRFGRINGAVIDNTSNITSPVGALAAQLICDSCHSIVNNIGPAKLLASGFANGSSAAFVSTPETKGTVTPTLCMGCHGDMDSAINAEWQYNPVATGVTWVGTQHHRNTLGSTGAGLYFGSVTPYSTNMAAMLRADYTAVQQMWAAGPGTLVDHTPIAYTGARMKAINDNNQIRPTAAQLLCTNCHRAHNADSSAGATILMRGDLAISASTLIGTATVPTGLTNAGSGLYRMADAGSNTGRSAAFNSTNALCLACHQ